MAKPNNELLQRLTSDRINHYLAELDTACENHARWLGDLNRTLICNTSPRTEDLSDHPHRLCQFGRWYHGIDDHELLTNPHFLAIGEVHTAMHDAARTILFQQQRGESITTEQYDNLTNLTARLRTATGELRKELLNSQAFTARIFGKLFDKAREGVIVTDARGHLLHVNDAFEAVTGYSSDEVLGKNPSILYSGMHDDEFFRAMWQELSSTGQWSGEIWNRRKDGNPYLEWLTISAIKDGQNEVSHYIGIFSDITTERESHERIQQLAHYDQLTGLPNRVLFQDRLQHALSQARRNEQQLAVLFMDLDGFKEVNDSLGHSVGDELLKQVGERLQGVLRESDTVARFGGDEFTVVLTDISELSALEKIANNILRAVANPYPIRGETLHLTTSIGAALFPGDGEESETLLVHADIAMYRAKRSGKNRFQLFKP